MKTMTKEHITWIDLLRVVACFLVIVSHFCDPFMIYLKSPQQVREGIVWFAKCLQQVREGVLRFAKCPQQVREYICKLTGCKIHCFFDISGVNRSGYLRIMQFAFSAIAGLH